MVKKRAKGEKRKGNRRPGLELVKALDQKVRNLADAVQRNFDQLFQNERAIADMSYTSSVRVDVIRRILEEKLEVTPEMFKKYEYAELAEREKLAAEQREQIKKKRAEEAAAKVAEEGGEQPAPEKEEAPVEPLVFGGDVEAPEEPKEVEDAVGTESGPEQPNAG